MFSLLVAAAAAPMALASRSRSLGRPRGSSPASTPSPDPSTQLHKKGRACGLRVNLSPGLCSGLSEPVILDVASNSSWIRSTFGSLFLLCVVSECSFTPKILIPDIFCSVNYMYISPREGNL